MSGFGLAPGQNPLTLAEDQLGRELEERDDWGVALEWESGAEFLADELHEGPEVFVAPNRQVIRYFETAGTLEASRTDPAVADEVGIPDRPAPQPLGPQQLAESTEPRDGLWLWLWPLGLFGFLDRCFQGLHGAPL